MIYIGMDIGLRSNGLVAINQDGNIIDQLLLSTFSSDSNTCTLNRIIKNEEDIIIYNCIEITQFIERFYSDTIKIGIERLSYNSISSSKDILSGIHWAVRSILKYKSQNQLKCKVISPNEWRKDVITRWDLVKYELEYPEEDMNKLIPYLKIPINQKFKINAYLTEYKQNNDCKKDSRYDLSDAYWIAKYLLFKTNELN